MSKQRRQALLLTIMQLSFFSPSLFLQLSNIYSSTYLINRPIIDLTLFNFHRYCTSYWNSRPFVLASFDTSCISVLLGHKLSNRSLCKRLCSFGQVCFDNGNLQGCDKSAFLCLRCIARPYNHPLFLLFI